MHYQPPALFLGGARFPLPQLELSLDLLLLEEISLLSVSSTGEREDWAPCLSYANFSYICFCFQLTGKIGLLISTGRDPLEVFRGRGGILLAFRRSLIS